MALNFFVNIFYSPTGVYPRTFCFVAVLLIFFSPYLSPQNVSNLFVLKMDFIRETSRQKCDIFNFSRVDERNSDS